QPRLRGPSDRGPDRGRSDRHRAQGAGGSSAGGCALHQAADRQDLPARGAGLLRRRRGLSARWLRGPCSAELAAKVRLENCLRRAESSPSARSTLMSEAAQPSGPDLRAGVPESALSDGCMLAGHVGEDAVLIARRGQDVFAIGATCTHYGGPLPEGLMVGETVRCPWHHACFSLRTGEAIAAPALS